METAKLDAMAEFMIRNAKKAKLDEQSPADVLFGMFLAAMNVYLRMMREEKKSEVEYQAVKTALQDIIGWFIMDFDIETFGPCEGAGERKMLINVETDI